MPQSKMLALLFATQNSIRRQKFRTELLYYIFVYIASDFFLSTLFVNSSFRFFICGERINLTKLFIYIKIQIHKYTSPLQYYKFLNMAEASANSNDEIVTLYDVLKDTEEMEAEVADVLAGSDQDNCTYDEVTRIS